MARSDEQLVRDARAGDETAFAVIHDRYAAALVGHARRVLGHGQRDAEDVVQESFLRAHRALMTGDREIHLRPWLYRIVHNCALDEWRRPPAAPAEDCEDAPDHADVGDPYVVLTGRDELREVLSGLAALPENHRAVLMAHAVHGESHEVVARELGITVSASKTRLSRARSQLAVGCAPA